MSAEPIPRPQILKFSGTGKPPTRRSGDPSPPAGDPEPTLRQLARQYLRERRAAQASGNLCLEVYRRERRILHRFTRGKRGRLPADDVRPSTVRTWLMSQKDWKSDHTRRDAAGIIRAMFRWAVGDRRLGRDPIASMRKCWDPPQPRDALTHDEYEALMATARKCNGSGCRARPSRVRFRFAVWFLWHTGCRTCELREVRWENIDWQRGLIVLKKHKTSRATGKPRLIALSRPVLRVLAWLLRRRRPDQEHVFTATAGRPLNKDSFGRLFRRFARLAGLRKGAVPYAIRHTWCVDGVEMGLSDRKVANSLGHEGTNLVGWYGRAASTNGEHLRGVADDIESSRAAKRAAKRRPKPPRPDQPGLFDD
jgi:integrase